MLRGNTNNYLLNRSLWNKHYVSGWTVCCTVFSCWSTLQKRLERYGEEEKASTIYDSCGCAVSKNNTTSYDSCVDMFIVKLLIRYIYCENR